MTLPDDIQARFNEVRKRLEAVHSQLAAPRDDCTVGVDAGDLEFKCRYYQEQVDKLLELAPTPSIDEALGNRLTALSVAIDDLVACCRDLKGPLDRLRSAVYERLPDDPRYADDAS